MSAMTAFTAPVVLSSAPFRHPPMRSHFNPRPFHAACDATVVRRRARMQQGTSDTDGETQAEAAIDTGSDTDLQAGAIAPAPRPERPADIDEATTLSPQPLYNSTLLSAMRDYFGDDGREVDEYTRRPRAAETNELLFRVVLAGIDVPLARALFKSGLCVAVYYVAPRGDDREMRVVVRNTADWERDMNDDDHFVKVTDIADDDIDKWAQLASSRDEDDEDEQGNSHKGDKEVPVFSVVEFASWAIADAVFVADGAQLDAPELQKALTEQGITMFDTDVGRAIVNGEIEVKECLSSLVLQDDDGSVSETLLE